MYEANEETGLTKKNWGKRKPFWGQRICTVEDIHAHQGINKT